MSNIKTIQLDIQGTVYTLPINPVEYESLNDFDVSSNRTVDGGLIRYTKNFDDRQRTMKWEGLPNTENFNEMVLTLRSTVGLSGIKLNHRGLSIYGDVDYWEPIRVDDVYHFYNSNASYNAIGNLKYDLEMKFSYLKTHVGDIESGSIELSPSALFLYNPDDYMNPVWIENISGWKGMDVIICHPDIGITNCQGLRAAFPNAKLLTYANIQEYTQRPGGAYWGGLRDAIVTASGYIITFLGGGTSTPGWQMKAITSSQIFDWEAIPQSGFTEKISYVWSGNVKGLYNGFEYDGIYIDMHTPLWPDWKKAVFNNFTGSGVQLDIDNDGIAESISELDALYKQGRNFAISGLRKSLPNKIIIANTAGDSYHPDLNGICIEDAGYSISSSLAHEWFSNQKRISRYEPSINIAWAISYYASGYVKDFVSSRNDLYYGISRGFWTL